MRIQIAKHGKLPFLILTILYDFLIYSYDYDSGFERFQLYKNDNLG